MAEVTREELAEALRAAITIIVQSKLNYAYPRSVKWFNDTITRLDAEQNGGDRD